MIPVLPQEVLDKARALWEESVDSYGLDVEVNDQDGSLLAACKAFCKRPKILGLFDRTEQSYDQERYMVIMKASDLGGVDPAKFFSIRWDDEDHSVISLTKVDLLGSVFGFRVLVKG